MKIIEQSHEFLSHAEPLKLIEAAGRTCYKSEDKITKDSAKRFVKMITKAGHLSVLEHALACFNVCEADVDYIQKSPYSKYLNTTTDTRCHVSGNFRAWREFFEKESEGSIPAGVHLIWQYLSTKYPVVFSSPKPMPGKAILVKENEMTSWEKEVHATRSVRFITDRGVTHEMVRHRPWGYSQESTRYVKYNGEMEFIKPLWCSDLVLGKWPANPSKPYCGADNGEELWLRAMQQQESGYQELLQIGWRPEQARSVLPNSLKTEIVCTASLGEWKFMLKLRTGKAAHPQIRALMKPVLEELKTEVPEVFAA